MPHLSVIVYDTTPEEAAPIRDYLAGAGMLHEDEDVVGAVRLGYRYSGRYGASTGEAAAYLETVAPASTWRVWSDPDEDELGVVARYAPGLGMFSAECGSDGDPYLSGKDLDALVEEAAGGDPVAAARRIGRPWAEAMNALLAARGGTVVEVAQPVDEPPPVADAALAELSAQLHMRCCPRWVDDGRCTMAHGADFITVAEAVVALGWRPWSAAGE